jgi:hypothetical protein
VDHEALADALVLGAKSYIDAAFAPILERLAALEARRAPEPIAATGIADILRNDRHELVFVLTNGETRVFGNPDGRDGVDGKDGAPGRDGADGKDGADGAPGLSVDLDVVREMIAAALAAMPLAKDGAPGRDGADGKDADPDAVAALVATEVAKRFAELPPPERGAEGPPGKLPIVTEWVDAVHYEGDCVTHRGASYQALRDTGQEPPHADWRCFAAAGQDGRSIAIRGTYDESAEYRELDVVVLGGASFVARQDSPGTCPGPGWQLWAAQGKRGQPGEPGKRGEPGLRGLPGPAVVRLGIDENGMQTLTNADGTTVQCDFYPVLAKSGLA